MWNRVLLLLAGMAFGWSLVTYWAAPPARQSELLARTILSLAVGGAVCVSLALGAPSAGLVGALVFLFSALVAYAGNARQVNKAPALPLLGRPPLPLEKDSRTAVLLVSQGEPAEYAGPVPWAGRFRQMQASGRSAPHWFVRPLAYARIRRAYRVMGRNPLPGWQTQLAQRLETRLGSAYRVGAAYLDSAPQLATELAHLAELGLTRIVLVPCDLQGDVQGILRTQVAWAHVREVGIQVVYVLSTHALPIPDYVARLQHLAQGRPVAAPPQASDEMVADMARSIRAQG